MFKQNALTPLKDLSQVSVVVPSIMGAVKEALLFNRQLDQLKESIVFFIAQLKAESSFDLSVQFWDNIIDTKINILITSDWEYISNEMIIVEHAGLSTYSLNWTQQLAEQSNLIATKLQTAKDFLDTNLIVRLAEKLLDLITTTSYNVGVYLLDYVRASCGEIEYGLSKIDYLDLENKQ